MDNSENSLFQSDSGNDIFQSSTSDEAFQSNFDGETYVDDSSSQTVDYSENAENYDVSAQSDVGEEYDSVSSSEGGNGGNDGSGIADEDLTKAQIKAIKKKGAKDKKIRRGLRYLRCRKLKNFFWWLGGVFSSLGILLASIFVGVGVVPVGTYLGGGKEAVSEKVYDKSILEVLQNITEYQVSDFGVLQDTVTDLIGSLGLDSYVEFDKEKFGEIKFFYGEDEDKGFATEILNCINLSSNFLGGTEISGTLTELGLFGEDYQALSEEELTALKEAEASTDGSLTFNPKLYYYEVQTSDVTPHATGDDKPKYARAFDDDGKRVASAVDKPLYYAPLNAMPVKEVLDVLTDRLSVIPVKNVLGAFVDLESSKEGDVGYILKNILGDTTIKNVGNIPFMSIKISDILTIENEDDAIVKVLCQIIDRGDGEEVTFDSLTVGDFKKIDTNRLTLMNLSTIIPYEDGEELLNDDIYKILTAAVKRKDSTVAVTKDNITIGDLTGETGEIDIDNIPLSTFVPYVDDAGKDINVDTYKLLTSSIKRKDGYNKEVTKENIVVGDLTGVSGEIVVDNVTLDTVIPYDENEENTLYDILTQATNKSAKEITVDDLSNLDFNRVKLSVVMGDGGTLLDMLLKAVVQTSEQATNHPLIPEDGTEKSTSMLTIGHLSGHADYGSINFDNVPLSVVGIDEDAGTIYDILCQASGLSGDDLTIGSITSGDFDIGNVKLTTAGITSGKLYDIIEASLREKTVIEDEDGKVIDSYITINDLTRKVDDGLGNQVDNFNVNNIPLSQIGISKGHAIYDILSAGLDNTSDIKVGDLSDFEIGNVTLDIVLKDNSSVSSNKILSKLVADKVAVNDLPTAINDMELSVLYGKDIFVTGSMATGNDYTKVVKTKYDAGNIVDQKTYYVLTSKITTPLAENSNAGNGYIYTTVKSGYKIDDKASIWLFMLYTDSQGISGTGLNVSAGHHENTGDAFVYSEKSITVGNISDSNNGLGSVSDSVMNATLGQLKDAGVITGSLSFALNVSINAILSGTAIPTL